MSYLNRSATPKRHSVLAALRGKGVATVKVHFSGGNDEGSADGYVFLDAEGKEIKPYGDFCGALSVSTDRWDQDKNQYVKRDQPVIDEGEFVPAPTEHSPRAMRWERKERPATEEELFLVDLTEVLEQPIYDRYGSFAGDFSVSGVCVWNVAADLAGLQVRESSYEYREY